MTNPYLGEIRPFAGSFAPRGWHYCDGSLQSIAQYDALYVLLGTTYGGDGQTTFALPDLRGRIALSQGQGPGLTNRVLGEVAGTETVTVTAQQMPAHTHLVVVTASEATTPSTANGVVPAAPKNSGLFYLPPDVGTQRDCPIETDSITSSGGNEPHNNIMPITAISYIIAMYGIFPSQN